MTETAKRIPADGFPVGSYLKEELEARGWSLEQLALRMAAKDIEIWQLTVELMIAVADGEPTRLKIDEETANRLGLAFDVSPEYWINLNNAYNEWLTAKGIA